MSKLDLEVARARLTARSGAQRLVKSWFRLAVLAFLMAGVCARGSAPYPVYGTAVVDGIGSEWSTNDFFANLYTAGRTSKPVLAKAYLRYNPTTETMYVLVTQASASKPLLVQREEAYVKAGASSPSTKYVSDENNNDGTPPDWAWGGLGYAGTRGGYNTAQSYEASFKIAQGTYRVNIHVNVWTTENETSAVGGMDIQLVVDFRDFGDLPDLGAGVAAGDYQTLASRGGPRHLVVPNLRLGTSIDAESEGQPSVAADGDDTHGQTPDDEDGVAPLNLSGMLRGSTRTLNATVFNNRGVDATLWGWVDFNANGVAESTETRQAVVPSRTNLQTVALTFQVPANAAAATYARFRLGTVSSEVATATGAARDGEVEDYAVTTQASAIYSISGRVRDDVDRSGTVKDQDRPVGGVAVRLFTDPNGDGDPSDGASVQTALTRPDGSYVFSNVVAATYVVVETDPTSSVSTGDVAGANDNRVPVVLVDADSVDNDFLDAIDPAGYLYDVADGRIVPGGSISVSGPGVLVQMDGSSGQYMFISTNGAPATYTVTVTPPPGYVLNETRPAQPGTFDPPTNVTTVVLGSGESTISPNHLVNYSAAANPYYWTFSLAPGDPPVINNNFPLVRLASIGDLIWNDVNADGLQDAGETGMVGVAVALLRIESGGLTTNVAATTHTDALGNYLFVSVPDGTYLVRIDAPVGYTFSTGYTTAPYSATFSVTAGSVMLDIDTPLHYAPTLAVLTSFRAFARDGQTVVAWEVAAEFDTAGYWIERRVGDAWVRINPDEPVWSDLLPWGPFTYELADPGAALGGTYDWRVVELEGSGAENVYGPYTVMVDGAAADFDAWAANVVWNGAAAGRDDDPDGDGLTNFEEFLAGTDALDADSTLRVTGLRPVDGGLEVRWPSVAGHVYAVEFARSFGDEWLPVAGSEAATPPENRFVLPLRPDQPTGLLRVVLKSAQP